MKPDYKRLLILLAVAGGVVLWLNANYSQSVCMAYLLLLATCSVVYYRPPTTQLDYVFLGGSFLSLWFYINSAEKDGSMLATIASLIGYMIL